MIVEPRNPAHSLSGVLLVDACTPRRSIFFFFNDTATTEIYTLSLHDALPIYSNRKRCASLRSGPDGAHLHRGSFIGSEDRKSTRLNSSHVRISYAVFCLKKKNKDRLQRAISLQHRLSLLWLALDRQVVHSYPD